MVYMKGKGGYGYVYMSRALVIYSCSTPSNKPTFFFS